MTHRLFARILALGVLLAVVAIGCAPKAETKVDKKTECAYVFPHYEKNIQDYVDYTARTAAVGTADVKARVTGFLLKDPTPPLFHEGDTVKKDQPLFLIDPTPYDAQLKEAEATVGLYKTQTDAYKKIYDEKQKLKEKNPNAIADLDLWTAEAQWKIADANLEKAKASLKIYQENKKYTTVVAPIGGVVGRRNMTEGNIIIQDQTLLTTIVALDKMYVYFDMDAPTYGQFRSNKSDKSEKKGSVSLELPGSTVSSAGTQAPQLTGEIDFFNNQFNPATDTILVRGIFDNPMKTDGGKRLRPGMFVRVRVSIGEPYKALVIPDQAIQSKMGKKYVYVVGDDNRVKEIPVSMGQLQEQGRVIKGGDLTDKDKVIVTRLLDIQPKQEIVPVPLQGSTEK
jgi:RND family efflux transporter MFP subunit